jgi:hypothetical protein
MASSKLNNLAAVSKQKAAGHTGSVVANLVANCADVLKSLGIEHLPSEGGGYQFESRRVHNPTLHIFPSRAKRFERRASLLKSVGAPMRAGPSGSTMRRRGNVGLPCSNCRACEMSVKARFRYQAPDQTLLSVHRE